MAANRSSLPGRLNLSKLTGKTQPAECISIKFNVSSFNTFSEDADDDFNPVTIETTSNNSEEISDETSKCAAVSEVATPFNYVDDSASFTDACNEKGSLPDVRIPEREDSANVHEKSSFFSGIRERLQERIPELMGKLEKLSADSPVVERKKSKEEDGERERCLSMMRKSESLDSASFRFTPGDKQGTHGFASEGQSRNLSVSSDNSLEFVDFPCDEHIISPLSQTESFEVVDNSLGANFEDLLLSIDSAPAVVESDPFNFVTTESVKNDTNLSVDSNILLCDEDSRREAHTYIDSSPSTSVMLPHTYFDTWRPCLPSQRVSIYVGATLLILLLTLPSFLGGVVLGCFLTALVAITLHITCTPSPGYGHVPGDDSAVAIDRLHFETPTKLNIEQGIFKGWLNLLHQYCESDFHLSTAQSVHIVLEGTRLRIQRPKTRVPKRALAHDHQLSSVTFGQSRYYNLKGCMVSLLPIGLCDKRRWSKKYPIMISLAERDTLDHRLSHHGAPCIDDASNSSADCESLYIFARTCRQKEEWFRRLSAAATGVPLPSSLAGVMFPPNLLYSTADSSHRRQRSLDLALTNVDSPLLPLCTPEQQALCSYLQYMAVLLPGCISSQHVKLSEEKQPDMTWLNALLGRCLWDFLREDYWTDMMKAKIQKKLAKVNTPYFIDELVVGSIDFGSMLPQFTRVAQMPYVDERGLWLHVDVAYHGGLQMALETKINLMKIKQYGGAESPATTPDTPARQSAALHSEEEDSAESSTDDEDEPSTDTLDDREAPTSKSKKFIQLVDRIAKSKYFQQATDYKYIRRALEGVSNTSLVLAVELSRLVGTLVINVPPPPTDRIWYGFATSLELVLCARPKVGERAVSVALITDWIQKKLTTEFQRVLVMPNMDDIHVPVMSDGLGAYPCATPTAATSAAHPAQRRTTSPPRDQHITPTES